MNNFDPVNNRKDFVNVISRIYRYTRYLNLDKVVYKNAKKKDMEPELLIMQTCEDAIENYITQWDACSTEQERAALVGGIRSPVI